MIRPATKSVTGVCPRVLLMVILSSVTFCAAQELAPRAYLVTPLHSNAITLSYSFMHGSLNVNGAVPVDNARGTYGVQILSYYHSFGFFGRSANVLANLPYAIGNFNGTLTEDQHLHRSGLVDSSYRVSVNLKGGPAMEARDFVKWKQKVLLGASLIVVAPTGQYDPTKLVNWGSNRWAFKPEFGYSQRWGHWIFDGAFGGWFFTTNHDFWSRNSYYSGTRSKTQTPIASLESHLSYDFRPGCWVSIDGNFWRGGTATVGGVENSATLQSNSRFGGTGVVRVSKHQLLKISYNNGAYIRFGGDYRTVSIGWQYSWLGKPN